MRLSTRKAIALAAVAAFLHGCSLRQIAVGGVGRALARGGAGWASEDDPELVRDAAPFALKTIESLLEESPANEDLLLAATRGFTQYAYAWVEQDADAIESQDLQRALELRARAKRLYRRAIDYGIRGLNVGHPGWRELPDTALQSMRREDLPLLYWTGMAWGGTIALAKDDAELTSDLELVGAIMRRALALDESYEAGAIHDFFIAYDGGRPPSAGGSIDRAREHLRRAVELSGGNRAAPLVTFASTVSVGTQNRGEFEGLLNEALAIDPDKVPGQRLSNLIYQKRARMLLSRIDELFAE